MGADVGKWFEERTFHHGEFADLPRLVELKRKRGVTISVCLPTMNVESTVGPMVRVFREELIERHPLVDELAIVDSRSRDASVEVAAAEGARVIYDDEILTDLTAASGKGEALWKSLFALEGDIVVWVDSDIEDAHPRFVYGLVGPLLADESVGYVKAFYRRPINEGGVERPTGGGRVTELTVRPLLNLFYPELSGLIQPLSGEYAGRRDVLESIPFLTGYGVESGMLIDVLERYGLDSIAQVDLEVRHHHNQPIESLSKMAFGIMRALMLRLDEDGKLRLAGELPETMNSVSVLDGEYSLKPVVAPVVQRPPMASMPGYAARGKGMP